MRVVLYDLGNRQHSLSVDWLAWRATLELLSRDGVLDKSELNRLIWRFGGAGTSIPENETRAIADYLAGRPVPGEDVRVDGEIEFDAVPEGAVRFSADDVPWNPAPARVSGVLLRADWLEEFKVFCRTSQGMGAVQEGVE
jgi:hypothetical protein